MRGPRRGSIALGLVVALVAALQPTAPAAADVEVWDVRSTTVVGEELPVLDHPIVAIDATGDGRGTWLVAADGGVFTLDDAPFHGSAGGLRLSGSIVSIAATGDDRGYWLAGADGSVMGFGAAGFHGSVADLALAAPVVAIERAPDDRGYWLVAADGGVFAFGSARFHGSAAGWGLPDVVDLVATPSGDGYWVVDRTGGIHRFGAARQLAWNWPAPGEVVGAAGRGSSLTLAWSSGVVDDVRSTHVERVSMVTQRTTVDVAVSGQSPRIAATGDRYRRLGPSIAGGRGSSVADFADASNARVGVVSFYANWRHDRNLPTGWLDEIHAMGAVPMIGWEPWDPDGDLKVQPDYQLRDIIDGHHDWLIDRWAWQAAEYGKPIMMRFAHEMNGDWYPWSELVNGNGPGEYAAAWRHVHSRFEAAGADNVVWVWNPNVETPWSTPMAQLWPGDDVVDFAAIDGYNAGTALPWGGWRSAESVIGSIALPELRSVVGDVPIVIGETGSTESGGDKAGWIADLFIWLEREHPDISMVIWFDESKETSWNVGSSPASAGSFARHGAQDWCGCAR